MLPVALLSPNSELVIRGQRRWWAEREVRGKYEEEEEEGEEGEEAAISTN